MKILQRKMSYEALAEQIKTLPEAAIDEVNDFITYIKLKSHFADFENTKNTQNEIETRLDEAELQASSTSKQLTHEEVFSAAKAKIKAK